MSHKRTVETARKRYDNAMNAVYAVALPRQDMRFSDCLMLARQENPRLAREHEETRQALVAAEQAAIDAGKAYRSSFGMLTWSR